MTNQKTFNLVATHLLNQGTRAQNRAGNCCYRTEDGLKCAAGCLISDDKYKPEWEGAAIKAQRPQGNSTTELASAAIWDLLDADGHNQELVAQLQYLHDYKNPEDWVFYLTELAEKNSLNTDVFAKIADAE